MNYIEMTKQCDLCRMVNDDVSCAECIDLNRCQVEEIVDVEKKGDKKMTYLINEYRQSEIDNLRNQMIERHSEIRYLKQYIAVLYKAERKDQAALTILCTYKESQHINRK